MKYLVLERHGESEWNAQDRYTGWSDIELTPRGREQGERAGEILRRGGFRFGAAYTSVLSRASETLQLALRAMDLKALPVLSTYRLNERHYGALEGLSKEDSKKAFGADQVRLWRRSYSEAPPPLAEDDPRYIAMKNDPRYASLPETPRTESLDQAVRRLLPYWDGVIRPSLATVGEVLIVAHGNIIRGLIGHLERRAAEEYEALEIPTATPLVYELDDGLEPKNSRLLDPAAATPRTLGAAA
jgi:2,3-bisphosphoglycerate-dependent phosphoglycerate mutase